MRTIDATLLANQTPLSGNPARSLVVGTAPNTIDLSAYIIGYTYEESSQPTGLTIYLDNKTGYFNTLSGDKAYIAQGAVIEFKRGLTVAGTDYLEELPRTWLETTSYQHEGGQSLFTLECIDWMGKLEAWRAGTIQSWSNTTITTILEYILTQVGLTRLAGAMTALSIDFDIRLHETGNAAQTRLMKKVPEYLYAGLDAEIKWKEIDGGDASVYTFGWNSDHKLLNVEAGSSAWTINSITVNGRSSYTGTASDATQISAVGTRKLTIYDYTLKSNANCTQRAQAELDLYEANATESIIVCRPCHGLELYDVVTVNNPPWGGSNVTGRVIRYIERRDIDGRWYQVIYLGTPPTKDPGKQPAKKSKARRRSSTQSSTYTGILRRLGIVEEFIEWLKELLFGEEASIGLVPIRGIIEWSGPVADIPTGWALCDGTVYGAYTTPDLRGRFIVGAGDAYAPDDTGGADEVNIAHTHDDGDLTTDADDHIHDVTGASGSESAHTHNAGTYATGAYSGVTYQVRNDLAQRDVVDDHTHDVSGTSGESGAHTHDDGTYAADSDSHSHAVTGGDTGSGGDTTHDNRPAYYALAFIMRVS